MAIEDLLDVLSSGSIKVTANGAPLAQMDGKQRSIEVDISGVRMSGLTVTRLLGRHHGGMFSLFVETEGMAHALARKGWKFELKDGPKEVVSMGRGVSGLTGPLHVSLFRMGTALEML